MESSTLKPVNNEFLDRNDRRLLIAAILGVVISCAFLFDDRISDFVTNSHPESNSRPKIGNMTAAERDVRHKGSGSLAWIKAHDRADLRLGDGVFTGKESKLKIDLDRGGSLELGQNTLLLFTEIDGIEIPNLMNGNLKIAVNGSMKISFQGKITELEGTGATISVQMEDGKPKLKLISGAANIKTNGKKITLGSKSEVMQSSNDLKIRARILAPEGPETARHFWKLHELYQQKSGNEFHRRSMPAVVENPVSLTWSPQGNVKQTFVQMAKTPVGGSEQRIVSSGPAGHSLNPVFVGDNYWWVSLDQKNWQGPFHFHLATEFAPDLPAPALQAPERPLVLSPQGISFPVQVSNESAFQGYLLETSTHPKFEGPTKIQWIKKSGSVTFTEPQVIYWRLRGVDSQTRLSVFSPTYRIETELPPLTSAPQLLGQKFREQVKTPILISWQNVDPSAKATQVTVLDSQGKVVERFAAQGTSWTWTPEKIGTYTLRLQSTDAWGRKSSRSSLAQILIEPKPDLAKTAQPEPLKRMPTAETALQTKMPSTPEYLNKDYGTSTFEIMGAGFTMFSTDQTAASAQTPIAYLFGLRLQHWFGGGSVGLEGSLKSKAGGVNEAASSTSPQSTEVRGLYRTIFDWNPLSPTKASSLAAVLGYESYKNSGSTYFAPGYDLMKAGFELNFPIFEKWDTGGEVLSGVASDKSKKTEISGFLHYFLKKEMSLGAGYRVHYFEAGSARSSPGLLPYREAFGEAFSTLRWHY